MGRRRQTKRHVKFVKDYTHVPDPMSRYIAAHPLKEMVAVAVGPCVRIVDCASGSSPVADGLQGHTGAVRLVQFSPDGKLLMTAGDERAVRVWDTVSWQCVASW
jgi:WD40 repeat protein